uniref:mucin-13 n=1 Tax=Myodes glareolus TaxID=447135 RepID=UPI00202018FA
TPDTTEEPEPGSTPEPSEEPEPGSTPDTTEEPEAGSTPEPSEEPESGSTPEPSGTTESPGVSSQTTSTGPQDPCKLKPCGGSASCVNLHSERLCLCSEGSYYQESSCVKGKTFPGEITMKVPESLDFEDKTSEAYQSFHEDVVEFFKKAFDETEAPSDYGQTIILKVSASPTQSARSAMRAGLKDAYVSVINMFNENTSQNESTISTAIEKAIQNGNGNVTNYAKQNLCECYGCVNDGKDCQDSTQCTCKPGLTRPNPLVRFCLPLECPKPCSAMNNEQCLKNGDGLLECACMPDYQKSTDGKCEPCSFGYSGQDCKDPFQLILTIVGTIAGALILILLIVFIVSASSKNKKKNVEEQKLIDEDFQNVRLQQTGFTNSGFSNSGFSNSRLSNSGFSNNSDYSNFGAGNSIFPKVKTGFPGQTQNPYANQRSMPRPDY